MAMIVDQHHEVGTDSLHVFLGGREHGRAISGGDCLAESEIRCQDRDATCQLSGTKAHQLLDEGASGDELLRGAFYSRMFGACEYCDQRHSLSDTDQSDDDREKSVAEASHNIGSNDRVHTKRRL